MPAVRLLVVDLDGTLLGREGDVSPRNRDAVRRAEAAGIEVVVATGRSWLESRQALAAIDGRNHDDGRERVFIGAGGAALHESRTGRVLRSRTVEAHLVEAIAASVMAHGHVAHMLQDPGVTGVDYCLVGDAALDPASEWWFRTFPITYRRHATLAEARPLGATMRVGTVAVDTELAKVAAALRADLGDQVMLQHWAAVTQHHVVGGTTHLLECFAPATDKWTMTLELCALRGIDPRATAAVGDGLNDVRMVAEAGVGVAMGNADPRVAAVARHCVRDNVNDGFAEAVELLLR